MKTEKNIFIAFILNLSFSIFEFIGGIFTGSVAIISDAIHDLGDAAGIGISYFLEKKSKKQPDEKYTYGYGRYSVLGGFITTVILLIGSVFMIYNAVVRIITPKDINYNGMIVFALIGVCVNFLAAFITREGKSVNQKAVNLHMLEDVLGWIIVLVGAIVMRFTDLRIIDPIMSIGLSVFIIYNAFVNLKEICFTFLQKAPVDISTEDIINCVESIDGITEVHHVHLWSMDGQSYLATLHAVSDENPRVIKGLIRNALSDIGIGHVTLELESSDEHCDQRCCNVPSAEKHSHCHHHHGHRHSK